MLKIKNTEFKEKFTEINLRQRNYQDQSYITVQFTTEFYPKIVSDQIVSGAIDIKLDLSHIQSLDDLSEQKYKGEIGSITISINNHGVWEHQTVETFELSFGKRDADEISFVVRAKDLSFESIGTIVSLYTTSTDRLDEVFEMKDFYPQVLKKEIGKSTISKYIVKGRK